MIKNYFDKTILPCLFVLIGLFIFPNFCFGAINELIINEIMYDLSGSDNKHEWIEILNTSDTKIDLTGWKFNDGSNHVLNEPPKNGGQGSLEISAGEYIILTGDAITFLTDHPGFSGTVIDTVMSLNNTAATLKIIDSEANEVDSISYESAWGAKGNGKTLEKIDALDANSQNNWQESVPDGGTPGALNSSGEESPPDEEPEVNGWIPTTTTHRPPVAHAGSDTSALVNQEIFLEASQSYDPDNDPLTYFWNFGDGATDTQEKTSHTYLYPGQYIVSLMVSDKEFSDLDIIIINIYSPSIIISEFMPVPAESEEENEWIELFNQSSQVANLTGWQLDDQEDDSSPFLFPANSLIGPEQFLVMRRPISQIALNNDNDQVRLIYPDGSIATEVSYLAENKEGLAIAFDGQDYFWTEIPTPGAANIISSIDLENENLSSNNPQPIIEETQELPEILAQTNLNQSQEFSALNPIIPENESTADQSSKLDISDLGEQAPAALGQTVQASSKANLILLLSIIIAGSLLASWLLISIRQRLKK